MIHEAELHERLQSAVCRHFGDGSRVERLGSAMGGGSNRTTFFDVLSPDGTVVPMVLRQETYATYGGPYNPFLSPETQYRLLKITYAAGVPVPRTYFLLDPEDGLGDGFAMERIEGETIPRKILRDSPYREALPRMAAQCGEILGCLHRIDASEVAFLADFPESIDPIAAQRQRLDDYREAHPAVEVGLRWLEENRPRARRTVLVHGDFRNGNFIVGPEGIRSVLDWECCHLGNPMEDLGWLCVKSWRFGVNDKPVGGFGDRESLYEAYERVSSHPVDPDQVYYWEVYGLLRWVIFNLMQAFGHVSLGRRSVVFAACGRNACEVEYDLLNMIDSGPPRG